MKQLPDRLTIVALIAFAILSLFAVKRLITTKESPTKTAVPQPVWPSTPADVVPRVRQAHRGPIANPDDTSAQKALKLVTQLVKDGQLDSAARELTRHLSSNWRDHLSFDQITTFIANSSSDVPLRTLLIDFLIHTGDLTDEEKDRLSQVLLTLAESHETDTALRKYALLALRDGIATDRMTQLRNIAEESATPPAVRGAAITALRRTGDEMHNAVVSAVLDNAATAETEVLRHAVVSAAKAGIASNRIGKLREIAMTTKDADVYASTIYALGLVGTQEAVVAIMNGYGRYENKHIARYALQKSEPAILQMLAADQPPQMLTVGIQAARSGGIAAAIQPLSSLRDGHADAEIRSKANEAIADLSAITDVNSKQSK